MSAALIQNAMNIARAEGPESERFVSQVLAQMAELRHSGQAAHGVVELILGLRRANYLGG